MKKFSIIFLSVMFFGALSFAADSKNSSYYLEFKKFKNSEQFKGIFDEDTAPGCAALQQNVHNFQQLTSFQRLVRFLFFALDTIIATPQTMPKLYKYVDDICKSQSIDTPTIFITVEKKGFYNAMAQKLLMSSGAIIIGQKLLRESSDEELEGVVAHELGHIVHNHVNKAIATTAGTYIGTRMLLSLLLKANHSMDDTEKAAISHWYAFIAMMFVPSLIIGKTFEQEADEFAYREMGKGQGMKEFFEDLIAKEEAHEKDFAKTYAMIQNAKVSTGDYFSLIMGYYFARTGNLLNKAFKWYYYNTPFGAHPSPQARIKAIDDYLENN